MAKSSDIHSPHTEQQMFSFSQRNWFLSDQINFLNLLNVSLRRKLRNKCAKVFLNAAS